MNPTILIVDDEQTIRTSLTYYFKMRGYEVFSAEDGAKAATLAAELQPDVVLIDYRLPDTTGIDAIKKMRPESAQTAFIVLTGYGSISGAVEAVRAGAFDYLTKPVDMDELELTIERALELQRLRAENQLLRKLSHQVKDYRMIGSSPQMHRLNLMVNLLAENSDTTVLIEGESGTGKELVARAIHDLSPRASKPLVAVNCASLSEHLLESELFGHEKGAFTDARSLKKGLLEAAEGGSLFLDEIGELSPMLQPKLLRMLETKTFRRVGGTRDIRSDVRFIAATNRNLADLVREKVFREDLYYRMKVMPIEVPPLRERGQDVLALARHFIANSGIPGKDQISIAPETGKMLMSYRWPGNVRELKNVMERALLLCKGGIIEPSHLPRELVASEAFELKADAAPVTLEESERQHIQSVYGYVSGNQSAAARLLGISRSTLIAKLKKYGMV